MEHQTNRPDSTMGRVEELLETSVIRPIEDFQDPKQEWAVALPELVGTFFLVLVAAGGGMMGQAFPDDQPYGGGDRARPG